MTRATGIQVATLWFVVLIYLQTTPAGGSPIQTAIAIVAILLSYVLPLALLAMLVVDVVGD